MPEEPVTVVFFGKVPTHGDFVRRRVNSTALRTFDAWIQEGMIAAGDTPGVLDADFEKAAPVAFCFSLPAPAPPFVGVLGPSRDSVGRRYPFLVGFEGGASLAGNGAPGYLPVVFGERLARAAALIRAATTGQVRAPDLEARVAPLSSGNDGDTALTGYDAFLKQTTASVFWAKLWGHPQDSRKYLLFKNLLDILTPLKGNLPAAFSLVLRFPLCTDRQDPSYEVAFWVSVVLQLLDAPRLQPSFFWTLPEEEDDRRPALLVALRHPPPDLFTCLLTGGKGEEACRDLETMGGLSAVEAALSIPSRYGSLLESDELTLKDFLRLMANDQ